MSFHTFRDGVQQTVYRVIDPPIRLMLRLGVTPNMVTTVGLVGNLAAAVIIVIAALSSDYADTSLIGWGGGVILFASLFDMVDGRLARTGNLCSQFGAFYDSVLDRYCELATLSALAFYFMRFGQHAAALITLLALIGSIMVSYIRARAEGLGCECKVGLMQRPERVVLTSLGAMLCGMCGGATSFDPHLMLIVPLALIALLANVTAAVRVLHVRAQM